MITDKQRREVARKLRERTKRPMGKSMQSERGGCDVRKL